MKIFCLQPIFIFDSRVIQLMNTFWANVSFLKLNCHSSWLIDSIHQQLKVKDVFLLVLNEIKPWKTFLGDSIVIARQLFNKYHETLSKVALPRRYQMERPYSFRIPRENTKTFGKKKFWIISMNSNKSRMLYETFFILQSSDILWLHLTFEINLSNS